MILGTNTSLPHSYHKTNLLINSPVNIFLHFFSRLSWLSSDTDGLLLKHACPYLRTLLWWCILKKTSWNCDGYFLYSNVIFKYNVNVFHIDLLAVPLSGLRSICLLLLLTHCLMLLCIFALSNQGFTNGIYHCLYIVSCFSIYMFFLTRASPMASITIRNLLLYTTNENWQVI